MEIKNILVIRFRRVGDATLSVSLCSSLRKTFPKAKIHYVLNENIAPLFASHPDIDKIITFNDYEMAKTGRYIRKVKSIMNQGKYDIIIDTRSTVKTLFFSLFSLHTPYRIGRKKSYNRFIQNYRIDNYPNESKIDNIELTLDLLNPLSNRFDIVKDPDFKLYLREEEKQKYAEYLKQKGVNLNHPIIVCAVATRVESKVWPREKMQQILQHMLQKQDNIQLIFNYAGEREKTVAESIYEAIGSPSRVFIDVEANPTFTLRS